MKYCIVIIDGAAIRSCVTPVAAAQNKAITTLEGLGNTKKLHKIQQAFVDEQAVQCGYCINGMIMTTKALLDKNPDPDTEKIKKALSQKPDDAYIRDSIGWVYYKKGEFANALTELLKAYQVLPDDPTIAEHIGDVYAALKEYSKAVEYFNKALELEKKEEKKKQIEQKKKTIEEKMK